MFGLDKSLAAWGTPEFSSIAKQEIAQHAAQLDLQQGLTLGNYVLDAPITVIIHGCTELEKVVRIHAGIFFLSVIAGCSCSDDPTPINELSEYVEIQLVIDKASSATQVVWLS